MSEVQFDYAQIGGVRLHYAKAGDGEKLVLLLHGFPEFWYSWRHQIAALSEEYTVVAVDMRGYNWSDKPIKVSDYKIDNLVDDVLGLIRHFGREQAAIVGHDWGAGVAWAVAMRHPEAVWKLACLQVPPLWIWQRNMSFKQLLASWYMFFFQIPLIPEWLLSRDNFAPMASLIRQSATNREPFTREVLEKYKESWREPLALASAINYYRANVLDRILKRQPHVKITVPTLFIYGEKDTAILPETVAGVKDAIEAPYEEIRIPESGHWVQQEAAEAVNDSLLEFLAAQH